MSTDADRIRAYYADFDEWGRLESADGAREFQRALQLLVEHLPQGCRVLDLGGGPGRYSFELARRGHRVVLADLSPGNLETARAKLAELGALSGSVESIDEVNATDLGRYADGSFDAVLAFGPFYHLLSRDERASAASEIARVLSPGGHAFVAHVARASGIRGLIERSASRPGQVTPEILREAADTGVFRNGLRSGFQEGYYPQPGEINALLTAAGLRVTDAVSLKSVLDGLGDQVASVSPALGDEMERIGVSLCRDPHVLAVCGHVLTIARRD